MLLLYRGSFVALMIVMNMVVIMIRIRFRAAKA